MLKDSRPLGSVIVFLHLGKPVQAKKGEPALEVRTIMEFRLHRGHVQNSVFPYAMLTTGYVFFSSAVVDPAPAPPPSGPPGPPVGEISEAIPLFFILVTRWFRMTLTFS